MYKDIIVWDYFETFMPGKSKCKFCKKSYSSSSSSTGNLKYHLLMKHPEKIGLVKTKPKNFRNLGTKAIWKYFKKSNDEDRLATCILCNNIVSYRTTYSNLKAHISTVHVDAFVKILENMDEEPDSDESENLDRNGLIQHVEQTKVVKLSRVRSQEVMKEIWKYFTKVKGDRLATCMLCDSNISYRSTTYNLKAHLSRSHDDAYQRLLQNITEKENGQQEWLETLDNDDSDDGDQVSADVWNYFEQETGGRVRCVVCRASKPNNVEDLKNHLEEHHPKLLRETSQETVDSDRESLRGDHPSYTEIIYLEDESTKKSPMVAYKKNRAVKRQLEAPPKVQKMVNKRRGSTPPEERPGAVQSREGNELESFFKYIKCLMAPLPADACAKLQLDIVNLIMSVKLNRSEPTLERCSVQVISNAESEEADRRREETVSNSITIDNIEHRYLAAEANASDRADES